MATKAKSERQQIECHKDGSIRAKGPMADGVLTGYWEWFRLDGMKLRSGYFQQGEQTGEWITCDKLGQVYKVTQIKPKPKPSA